MESIGEKLKTKREELGYSIEQIARDTNIAKRYIGALEDEDFDVFPGEPYLLGFLRTYAEYLNLDPDEIVGLYKNFKIQEQPIPMDELIEKKSRKPLIIGIIVALLIGGGVAGWLLFFPDLFTQMKASRQQALAEKQRLAEENSQGTSYEMTNELMERRFFEGDEIVINYNDSQSTLQLISIGDELAMQTPVEKTRLKLGEERRLDLNGDGSEDILVYLRDIENNNDNRSVVLRLDKFTQASVAVSAGGEDSPGETDLLVPETDEQTSSQPVSSADIGTTELGARKQRVIVLEESAVRQPLTVDMVFRGYCLLRYVADDRVREERYFHKGETFRLEANNQIRLWISNAGSVKTRISGKNVDLGRPGEVVTKLISWVKDEESGDFELRIIPVY